MKVLRDESGIVVSWLVKLVVGLGLAGLLLFDAGSIAVNFFGLDSTARDIAIAVSTTVVNDPATRSGVISCTRGSTLPMCVQARELAREANARLAKAELDPEGIVRIKLKRTASTLLVSRIGPIKDWAKATAEGQSGTT